MMPRRCAGAALALALLLVTAVAQDDLADYPIKEEQCENFGECLTECVKKLPPNRQFTEIVSSRPLAPRCPLPLRPFAEDVQDRPQPRAIMGRAAPACLALTEHGRPWSLSARPMQLDCSDACAVTNCREVIIDDPALGEGPARDGPGRLAGQIAAAA
jgi:hypothetical protein